MAPSPTPSTPSRHAVDETPASESECFARTSTDAASAASTCGSGNTTAGLEAAHIQWHHVGGPDIETNGLSLCALHHKLFDLGAFTVEPAEHRIIFSQHAVAGGRGVTGELQHHGRPILPPQHAELVPAPTVPCLEHRERVQDARARVTSSSTAPTRPSQHAELAESRPETALSRSRIGCQHHNRQETPMTRAPSRRTATRRSSGTVALLGGLWLAGSVCAQTAGPARGSGPRPLLAAGPLGRPGHLHPAPLRPHPHRPPRQRAAARQAQAPRRLQDRDLRRRHPRGALARPRRQGHGVRQQPQPEGRLRDRRPGRQAHGHEGAEGPELAERHRLPATARSTSPSATASRPTRASRTASPARPRRRW